MTYCFSNGMSKGWWDGGWYIMPIYRGEADGLWATGYYTKSTHSTNVTMQREHEAFAHADKVGIEEAAKVYPEVFWNGKNRK